MSRAGLIEPSPAASGISKAAGGQAEPGENRLPRDPLALNGRSLIKGRLTGGMIRGISSALHEATESDHREARVVNRASQDYLGPVNADIEELKVILIPEVEGEVNPAGLTGLGKLGNVGTAGISRAVFNVAGKRVRELPIRIEKLLS